MNAAEREFLRAFWGDHIKIPRPTNFRHSTVEVRWDEMAILEEQVQAGPPPYAERVAQILGTNGSRA